MPRAIKQFCPRGHKKEFYKITNRLKCMVCHKVHVLGWKIRNREYLKEYFKKRYVYKKRKPFSANGRYHSSTHRILGIRKEQFDEMVAKQNNKCAICLIELTYKSLDHDHKTGIVRGVLCRLCNFMLGSARDSIDILLGGIQYLKNHSAQYR